MANRTGRIRRWRAALVSGSTFAAFRLPGYASFWIGSASGAFGTTVGAVTIGWITLVVSNSAVAVGAVLAARLAPSLLLGIPLGGVVDRFDRRRTLIATSLLGAVPLAAMAALAGAGQLSLAALLILSVGLGILDTIRGTAAQAYSFDLAGPDGASNAIALSNLGGFVLGVVGSIAGGGVLDGIGASGAFLLASATILVASGVLAFGARRAVQRAAPRSAAPSLRQAATLLARNQTVAVVAVIVVVAEILGFSCATLFPSFARDVLQSDASGLGALTAARYVGSIAALLVLARAVSIPRNGRLILIMTGGLGLSLVAFAQSRSFALSLALVFVVGVASAGLDALVSTLLQRSVHDSERGSAMGVWYFAIGFGPIGQIGLGAAANAVGAPAALAVSGGLLAVIAVILSAARLRGFEGERA